MTSNISDPIQNSISSTSNPELKEIDPLIKIFEKYNQDKDFARLNTPDGNILSSKFLNVLQGTSYPFSAKLQEGINLSEQYLEGKKNNVYIEEPKTLKERFNSSSTEEKCICVGLALASIACIIAVIVLSHEISKLADKISKVKKIPKTPGLFRLQAKQAFYAGGLAIVIVMALSFSGTLFQENVSPLFKKPLNQRVKQFNEYARELKNESEEFKKMYKRLNETTPVHQAYINDAIIQKVADFFDEFTTALEGKEMIPSTDFSKNGVEDDQVEE